MSVKGCSIEDVHGHYKRHSDQYNGQPVWERVTLIMNNGQVQEDKSQRFDQRRFAYFDEKDGWCLVKDISFRDFYSKLTKKN